MAQTKPATKRSQKSAKSTGASGRASKGLSAEERAALRETVQERKAAERGENDEKALLAKIATMPGADRAMAKRLHAVIKASAPDLSPKTWYGMPAYANKDGKVVCFFTPASKCTARCAEVGFTRCAHHD